MGFCEGEVSFRMWPSLLRSKETGKHGGYHFRPWKKGNARETYEHSCVISNKTGYFLFPIES